MGHTRNQKRMYRIKKLEERIVDLENISKKAISELSTANNKLKKIEEYIYGHKLFGMRYGKTLYRESLINILSIIKGDD